MIDLVTRLAAAVARTGLRLADIVLRAMRNDFDRVSAYACLADDLAQIKNVLADRAGAAGEVLDDPKPGSFDVICRWRPGQTTGQPPATRSGSEPKVERERSGPNLSR